jgi:hypothetical protein
MNGFSIGQFCSTDDGINIEITLKAGGRTNADAFVCQLDMKRITVRRRIYGNCLYSQFLASPDNPQSNFTTICYEYFMKHPIISNRERAYCLSGIN